MSKTLGQEKKIHQEKKNKEQNINLDPIASVMAGRPVAYKCCKCSETSLYGDGKSFFCLMHWLEHFPNSSYSRNLTN